MDTLKEFLERTNTIVMIGQPIEDPDDPACWQYGIGVSNSRGEIHCSYTGTRNDRLKNIHPSQSEVIEDLLLSWCIPSFEQFHEKHVPYKSLDEAHSHYAKLMEEKQKLEQVFTMEELEKLADIFFIQKSENS